MGAFPTNRCLHFNGRFGRLLDDRQIVGLCRRWRYWLIITAMESLPDVELRIEVERQLINFAIGRIRLIAEIANLGCLAPRRHDFLKPLAISSKCSRTRLRQPRHCQRLSMPIRRRRLRRPNQVQIFGLPDQGQETHEFFHTFDCCGCAM